MDELEEISGGGISSATKRGAVLEFARDPHPGTDRYLVIEGPGMLVLFPNDKQLNPDARVEPLCPNSPVDPPDRDSQLCRAFAALKERVPSSSWTASTQPYTDLIEEFRRLECQPAVREDVATYLAANPSVESAIEMLFTSIAMSARADWRAAPERFRVVMARGWFLGRWMPTFLVLDGPIMRFLISQAFRRQTGSPVLLRSVRAFFANRDFMLLRHAFAHWSFSWKVDGGDSEIVAIDRDSSDEIRVSRSEADAFHIIAFALVEAVNDVFMERRPTSR